ncbi:MAG TPA: DNA translocase FtsK [Candidatus Limnocylindrales bacterium]|nr:DNA translocase FtsK [Candidatus Limnocylindrales bacterium]
MAGKVTRQARRGNGPRGDPRIRAEVAAIALLALAVLSVLALALDQGAVLHWWRELLTGLLGWGAAAVPPALAALGIGLWVGALRAALVVPAAGGTIAFVALLGLADVVTAGAGGALGGALAGTLRGALGDVGTAIALLALAAIGIVVGTDRTVADLIRPAWQRRPRVPSRGEELMAARGRDAARDERAPTPQPAPSDEIAQLRINLPPERAPAKRPALRVLDGGDAEPAAPPAGLPSAAIAAEGVLHAKADREWKLPPIDLLSAGDDARVGGKGEVEKSARVIEETLAHFNIAAKVVEATVGPVVTRYEIKPAPGVKLSRIEALSDDLALALAARTLRIEAPIPGKSVVGIEVPNIAVGLVSLRDVVETTAFKSGVSKLTVALGRDVAGSPIVLDLAAMPHLLVAGQTGSGKSVSISSIICSLLLNATPDEVRLLIGDLKRVDFAGFAEVPHLVVPVMTDAEKILNALYWVTGEMDRRYRLFARASARNIAAYNESRAGADRIPYIVFLIDELADLMLQAPIQVEKQITRVAQLARATGIHLAVGTQRPSVDVITGLIKANIPARVAFATASAVDSRTILDMTGAEKLLGRGDMLVLRPDLAKPIRAQGVFVSDKEIAAITRHWILQSGAGYDRHDEVVQGEDRLVRREEGEGDDIEDERYEEAVDIVRRAGQASVSMLQRKMTIGFARAGRLVDLMEREGVIGPSQGPGKMREVYGAPRVDADDGGA